MRCVVATRSSKLNVRSGPGVNFSVVSQLRKGTYVEVVETRRGWGRMSRGWVSAQYLSPNPAQSDRQAAAAPMDPPTASNQEIASAERKLTSFIRWRNPPQAEAGMGGIFLGESAYGRLNYPYLNWLNAYYHTMEAFLRGEPQHRARQAWPNYARRRGVLVEQGGRNGTLKADGVWFQIPNRVRNAIAHDYQESREVYGRVTVRLRTHIQSETRRLLTPHDYGIIDRVLGVR